MRMDHGVVVLVPVDRPAWLPKATAALLLLYMVSKALGGDFFYGAALHPPGVAFNTASVVVRLLFYPCSSSLSAWESASRVWKAGWCFPRSCRWRSRSFPAN